MAKFVGEWWMLGLTIAIPAGTLVVWVTSWLVNRREGGDDGPTR